ncbi:MAG: hypothetical protein NC548_05665 [Lachnospiraceae bacterium]|nr:hypothetical protein [Lachnospiraceae bacterium]
MQSIALESYYIFDDDVIAMESTENLSSMIIGFIVQIIRKLGQLILANWPRLLAILAAFVIPAATARMTGVRMDGLVNNISEKMTSIGNHVIGVIQDLATGLRDITVANIHLGKIVEDNQEMVELNNQIVKHVNTHAGVVGKAYITKDTYAKCQDAYNTMKDIIGEANERLQKARDFNWEAKGANHSAANEVRKFFSDIQGAFSQVLKNASAIMTNITTGLARYKR